MIFHVSDDEIGGQQETPGHGGHKMSAMAWSWSSGDIFPEVIDCRNGRPVHALQFSMSQQQQDDLYGVSTLAAAAYTGITDDTTVEPLENAKRPAGCYLQLGGNARWHGLRLNMKPGKTAAMLALRRRTHELRRCSELQRPAIYVRAPTTDARPRRTCNWHGQSELQRQTRRPQRQRTASTSWRASK